MRILSYPFSSSALDGRQEQQQVTQAALHYQNTFRPARSHTAAFSFLLALQLLMLVSKVKVEGQQGPNNGQPIKSEATQLYCRQCKLDCFSDFLDAKTKPLLNEEQQWQKAPQKDTKTTTTNTEFSGELDKTEDAQATMAPNDQHLSGGKMVDTLVGHTAQETVTNKLRLDCSCKSVFDSRTGQILACKNVSSAEAKLRSQMTNSKEPQLTRPHLEAHSRAIARAEVRPSVKRAILTRRTGRF